MSIELPNKVRPPLTQSPNVLLLYGSPKCGKTSSVVKLEGNLIFDLESGGKLLSGLIVDVPEIAREERISPLNLLRKYYTLLKQNGNGHYCYVTFDTIEILVDLIIEEISQRYGITHLSDLGYGKGYSILKDDFFKLINAFKDLGIKLILIAHRKRSIIGESGAEVIIKDLDILGSLKNIVMAYCDCVGYIFSSDQSLMVSFKPGKDESLAAGSRINYLANKEIELGRFNRNGELIQTFWSRIFLELNGQTKGHGGDNGD